MLRRPGDDETPGRAGACRNNRRPPGRLRATGFTALKIVDHATGEGVGWVGYSERDWRGEPMYEIGWAVVPDFQGRGIAGLAALKAIAIARPDRKRRFLHAYPSINNTPSNAMCRKLGLTLLGPCEFEYPKGSLMHCNDWRLDLCASGDDG